MRPVSRYVDSHADFPQDRVSYSILKELDKSPAEALYKKQNPKPASPAMEFGSLVEQLLTEIKDYEVHPTNASTRTNEFKAAKETSKTKLYVDQETYGAAAACSLAVRSTPLWQYYIGDLGTGTNKKQVHGVLMVDVSEEGRYQQCIANVIDIMRYEHGDDKPMAIYDLKVVADPSPHSFRNQVDRMRWDVQAASYVQMVNEIEMTEVPFFWFAVANTPPHTCAIYEFNDSWNKAAREQLREWAVEWFLWKNEDPSGSALCLAQTPIMLETPPWRK